MPRHVPCTGRHHGEALQWCTRLLLIEDYFIFRDEFNREQFILITTLAIFSSRVTYITYIRSSFMIALYAHTWNLIYIQLTLVCTCNVWFGISVLFHNFPTQQHNSNFESESQRKAKQSFHHSCGLWDRLTCFCIWSSALTTMMRYCIVRCPYATLLWISHKLMQRINIHQFF